MQDKHNFTKAAYQQQKTTNKVVLSKEINALPINFECVDSENVCWWSI